MVSEMKLFLILILLGQNIILGQVIIDQHRFTSGSVPSLNGLLLNLQAYWKGDESSGDLLDSSTNGRDLTESGGTIISGTGILNGDRVFGDNEYFTASHDIWNDMTGLSWTFMCWVKFTSLPSVGDIQYLFFKVPGANPGVNDGYYSLYLEHDLGGTKSFVIATKTDTVSITPSPDVTTGVWYFVAARHDSGSTSAKVSFGTGSTLTHGTTNNSFDPIQFSDGPFAIGGTVHPLIGEIDEVALWQGRYLSDADLAIIFNSGTPLPFSSYTL
jgi:hypothetical protein